jgi:hypothetical protein
LLIQRQPHQCALLNDRKGAEDRASSRDSQRNGQDKAG